MNKHGSIKESIDISDGFWDATDNHELSLVISENLGREEHHTVHSQRNKTED
ncbi:hypothetical protein VV869_01780 [Photobacterium sp. MCCC 1A19761]|uniref:hypothetical protein n=1 Tax=Photobacterium sp. MCCC 1A19761 TaxID=3115000 RepID=UPI00307F0CC8